ncbi:MAG TPA: DUF4915 domain-containing protein [Pyrinomonadaceae bacterium]|jgi:uncharacterized protein (TIGR03032 family)
MKIGSRKAKAQSHHKEAQPRKELAGLWARHNAEWRDGAQITSQWQEAAATDPALLRSKVRGRFWETLAETGMTLLVSREYEHMLVALRADAVGPKVTFMRLPHPSGIAVDRARAVVYVASTRNPNQVYDLAPVTGLRERLDVSLFPLEDRPLVPVRSRFLPGSLYLHDLALIGRALYATAVGENAIVRLYDQGRVERVWWPRAIEGPVGPTFTQNYIQLNSIAAGPTLKGSYFSASAERMGARRPGHRNFAVDGRGVIFSGATREVFARGLTRPHSARIHEGRVWVDNSGYGELGVAERGAFTPVVRLPGWTRGLCFQGSVAFVGTSRVIPRFSRYAPGLDLDKSTCGVHAVDLRTGVVLGSLTWPYGNQIFAVEAVESSITTGFAFDLSRRRKLDRQKKLFYTFATAS